MTILNIGGAGFIGSVATETFIKNGHKVVVLDDLSTGFKKLVHPKAIFIKGSMLNYKTLDKIFKKYKIDVVALFAAKISVAESVLHPNDYMLTNVGGTKTVLEAMHDNKIKNIIFASSAAVYGNCKRLPINEKSPTKPCNPYGLSKLMCEKLLIEANKTSKLNFVCLRFFNVGGASDSNKFGMLKEKPSLLVSSMNNCILKNRPVLIFGNKYDTRDGTCIRDYIHVEDAANAAFLSLKQLKTGRSGIYCLGSNEGHTVLEVVKLAKKLISKKVKYEFKPNRSGDPSKLIADNKKASKCLGWKPKHTIKDIILSDYKFRKTHLK